MASPELTTEENEHLRGLVKDAIARFGSANKLALKLEMQGSSLGAFLKGGGWSKDTARKFATLVGVSYEEALGHGSRSRSGSAARTPVAGRTVVSHEAPPASGPPAFRPTARALERAKTFLMEHPQKFSAKAIDYAAEEIWLTTAEEADRPSAVAEAIRHAILGSAVHFPLHPNQPPSSSPPAGTRRSRMRGR